jgi:hypothetical protein
MEFNDTFIALRAELYNAFSVAWFDFGSDMCMDCVPVYQKFSATQHRCPDSGKMGNFMGFLMEKGIEPLALATKICQKKHRGEAVELVARWEDGNHGFGPCIGINTVVGFILEILDEQTNVTGKSAC